MYKKKLLATAIITCSLCATAQQKPTADTEIFSPEPVVVTPGNTVSELSSDAIILFNGSNLNEWVSVKDSTAPAKWTVSKGIMTVDKQAGTIRTRRVFLDYQLHVEWRIPKDITGEGQARGNSGIILASTGAGDNGYELQVLDSYHNKTYVNGQAGAVYKQYVPLVNASKKPGEWQTYDIVWFAPRFNEDGSLKTPAHLTAFHNGLLIQYDVAVLGPTAYWPDKAGYHQHGATAIKLQAHGDSSKPISYRNIWIRQL